MKKSKQEIAIESYQKEYNTHMKYANYAGIHPAEREYYLKMARSTEASMNSLLQWAGRKKTRKNYNDED